ncbi:MAG: hypothetical protein ABS948_15230 [Solibacillus sp.]
MLIKQELDETADKSPAHVMSTQTNKYSLIIVSTSVLLFSGVLFGANYSADHEPEQHQEPVEELHHHH